MSTLYVDTINEKTSGSGVQIPGHVVQVVSAAKTDTFSVSNSTFADVTGLSVTITPKASTNKILVLTHLHLDALVGGYTHPWRLMRNSTPIAVGDAAGSRRQASGGGTSVYTSGPLQGVHQAVQWLDAPSTTSATTYKVQLATYTDVAGTAYINRGYTDTDSINISRYASSITLMEIAQ